MEDEDAEGGRTGTIRRKAKKRIREKIKEGNG